MKNKLLHLSVCFLFNLTLYGQSHEKQCFKIISYNVENYFDCVDDTLTNDAEYVTGGIRGWNYEKYLRKQSNISKVIVAIGGWEAPAIIGLCEIENEKCLRDLTRHSGLKQLKYKYLHHESPDSRGVDVALLYKSSYFKPFHDEAIGIHYPDAPQNKTRDLLYAAGVVPTGDTLHCFVCHFPSRLGGELESEDRRIFVASVLRLKIDSLFAKNPRSNIVIMGDFNDYPTNASMLKTLQALPPTDSVSDSSLYNLMFPIHTAGKGSHKHEGSWGSLDQIIVSGNLLKPSNNINTLPGDAHVFDAGFLLEDDEKFLGKEPFRTYNGMKYQGGFSDHLPVYVDLWY